MHVHVWSFRYSPCDELSDVSLQTIEALRGLWKRYQFKLCGTCIAEICCRPSRWNWVVLHLPYRFHTCKFGCIYMYLWVDRTESSYHVIIGLQLIPADAHRYYSSTIFDQNVLSWSNQNTPGISGNQAYSIHNSSYNYISSQLYVPLIAKFGIVSQHKVVQLSRMLRCK